MTCPFCVKFGRSPTGKSWFDRELLTTDDFAIVPAVGALMPGYLMLLTRDHYPSMAVLPGELWPCLGELMDQVADVCETVFKSPALIFEHGAVGEASLSAGGCIDHAHFQVMPTRLEFFEAVSKDLDLRPIRNLEKLRLFATASAPYFYLRRQDGKQFVSLTPGLPSQFARQVVARMLGSPDRWDYGLFRGENLIRETMALLTPWPDAEAATAI